jgi:methionyl aminopeptidase
MIPIKTASEIQIMREGGKTSAAALKAALDAVKPGVSLYELDQIAEKTILSLGAQPSFKRVEDYRYTTCLNINEGIVHGIPSNYRLKKGDVLSIDLGAYYKGFHTDLSWTTEVESNKEQKFLETGRRALEKAIFECIAGNRLGNVCHAIQETIEREGYSVSDELVGHGVGKELHEDPYVPGYGKKGTGPILEEGMTLAIEVIYQKGRPELVLDEDGWTLKTADGSLSGLFEHTVYISKNRPEVLTQL